MLEKTRGWAFALLIGALLLASCGQAAPEPVDPTESSITNADEVDRASAASDANLAAIKDYLIVHGTQMEQATDALRADAEEYFQMAEAAEFDDERLWQERRTEVTELLQHARQQWILAHNDYELIEGIVAGVPSLAYYDTWLDAGPRSGESPDECVDWTLELADGRRLDGPGNIFHHLLETTMWGTVEEFKGLAVDLDGDGEVELGEALPEAYTFRAAAMAMNEGTAQMNTAIDEWTPSMDDSFTALLTMIPTMGEYFEEWKLSSYITGQDPRFVAQTRLVDIKGIATSLDVIYSHVGPAVAEQDPSLNQQICGGFDGLLDYLDQVYTQEQVGVEFSPEEADSLGTEAQDRAQALAALVAQAAAALELDIH